MPFNCGADSAVEREYAALALFCRQSNASRSIGCGGKILPPDPASVFVGVAPFYPAPYPIVHMIVQLAKSLLGCSVAIIVGPTTQARVEVSQERLLREAPSRVNPLADLLAHDRDLALGRGDQQRVLILAHGVPQKVKALADVRQDGLLLCEPQTSLGEEGR